MAAPLFSSAFSEVPPLQITIADFIGSVQGISGTTVSASNPSVSGGTSPYTYVWSSSGLNITPTTPTGSTTTWDYFFPSLGTYTSNITLTVTDDDGKSSAVNFIVALTRVL